MNEMYEELAMLETMINDMHEQLQYMGLDSHIPSKGWGYSVVSLNGMYEVCPFYNGDIPMNMDVIMCRDFVEVAKAIEQIMDGKAPRYDRGEEE